MPLVLADRVKDTTTTTGTGTITLSGTAPIGYVSFGTAIGNANTTYYTITAGSEWEVGVGTYTAAGTLLSRDTVLASSAGGTTKVTFSAGTKDVFVTYPAGKAIYEDGSDNVGIGTLTPGARLDVAGNIRLSAASPNIELNNGGRMVYGPAANTLAFATAGGPGAPVERMRIDSSGNIGIGTTSISYRLEVAGDVRIAGSGGDLRIQSATGTTSTGGDSQIYNDANNMVFTTGTTTAERFRIGSVGQWGIGGATYGTSGQVFSSGGPSAAPTWLTLATVATSGSFADLSNKPGIRSNGQNAISATTTLGAGDKGTNILILTSGITLTFPSSGYSSGEGVAISNVSGGSITLSAPGGSDFGTTLPDNGAFFAFCDGGGFWRQYCYSTERL
jgi:hypothetical protein